ncbi:MAG: hypothetical protein M1823_001472 [Watsoniomyces obsoletus]|nr:MAG: hypothetical protein M1823_001472 [Watsoniomyces obsoletus]
MPPKGTRRHHASNQHGPRNETGGAVASTRKTDKHGRPKANGVLNGSPLSSTRENGSSMSPRGPPSEIGPELEEVSEPSPLHPISSRRSTDPLLDELIEGQHQPSMSSMGREWQQTRRIDVNGPGNPAVHVERGPVNLASRIIRASPLADTLAILMVLLQMPQTLLNILQFLYAFWAFVPWLTSMFPPLTWLFDFLLGAEGAPSVATILVADFIMGCTWMCLWTPLQDLILDLIQAIIAGSWGGRSDDNDGGIRNTGIASIVVTVLHFARVGRLTLLRSTPEPNGVWSYMSEHLDMMDYRRVQPTSDHSVFRVLMAVHIVAQGLLHIVRRALTRQDNSSSDYGRRRSVDSSSSSEHSSATISVDPISVTVKDGKDHGSRTKHRRKQSALSRGLQPFWAFVAYLKCHTLNDHEHTQANKEATGARATDERNLGNAPFRSEEGCVWATRIDSTEIFFQTSFFQTLSSSTASDVEERGPANHDLALQQVKPAGKPFYVRVNNATWPSTRMQQLKVIPNGSDPTRSQWTVEVFGLTPGSSYACEFINNQDHAIIYRLHITTPLVSVADSSASSSCFESTDMSSQGLPVHGGSTSAAATVPSTSLRPSSPTTALKQSVAAAEHKLDEERGTVKKLRKEHKSLVAGLKKEMDTLNSRSSTSGSGDDRQRQRLTQISQHIRQAEDAAATMVSQTEEMKVVPEEEMSEWRETRERWEALREQHSEAQSDLTEHVSKLDRQKSSVHSEVLIMQQRRERVQARQAKLTDQHHRLSEPTSEGLKTDENVSKATPPPSNVVNRASLIEDYTGKVRHLQHTHQEIQLNGQQIWQQVRLLESAHNDQQLQLQQQQQQMMMPSTVNKTPETVFAGNYTTIHNPVTPRFGNLTLPTSSPVSMPTYTPMSWSQSGPGSGLQHPHPHHHQQQQQQLQQEGRLRSSSMRSNPSGLNEYVDGPIQPREAAIVEAALAAAAAANGSEVTYRDMARGGMGGGGSGDGSAPGSGSVTVTQGRSRSGSQRDPAGGSHLPRPSSHMQQQFAGGGGGGGKGSSPVWQ